MILRPYQSEAIEACRAEYRAGKRRVLLQASTGAGKTVIAAAIVAAAVAKGRRVLYVCHRGEIIAQTAAKLRAEGLAPVMLTAGRREVGPLTLASAQTLARREVPAADLVVVDEAHVMHEASRRVLAALPAAHVLCLTATPARTDGRPLSDLADAIVQGPPMAWLIAQGYLVPATVYAAPSPDLHDVPIRGGEYAQGPAEHAHRRLVGTVAAEWAAHCRGLRTILFASGVAHSRECVAALTAAGARAAHVDGATPAAERADLFAALRAGALDVLCNVGIAIEGLDIPEIEAVYWARSTASVAVWLQGCGRGMRPSPGKKRLIIVDGGGNVYRHGLPAAPRMWTLHGRVPVVRQTLRTCAACLAVWSDPGPCPRCGAEPVGKPRAGIQVCEVGLVEVSAAELERRARAGSREVGPRPCPAWAARDAGLWERLERKRQREGYALGGDGKPGWTAVAWRRIKSASGGNT